MANTQKVLIGMSTALLSTIDHAAKVNHCSRSEYIRSALRQQLKNETGVPTVPPVHVLKGTPDTLAPVVPINATTVQEPEEYTATVV